jgi:hypothetical protein
VAGEGAEQGGQGGHVADVGVEAGGAAQQGEQGKPAAERHPAQAQVARPRASPAVAAASPQRQRDACRQQHRDDYREPGALQRAVPAELVEQVGRDADQAHQARAVVGRRERLV